MKNKAAAFCAGDVSFRISGISRKIKNVFIVCAGDVVDVKEKLYVNFLTVFGVYSAKYTITIIGI